MFKNQKIESDDITKKVKRNIDILSWFHLGKAMLIERMMNERQRQKKKHKLNFVYIVGAIKHWIEDKMEIFWSYWKHQNNVNQLIQVHQMSSYKLKC